MMIITQKLLFPTITVLARNDRTAAVVNFSKHLFCSCGEISLREVVNSFVLKIILLNLILSLLINKSNE